MLADHVISTGEPPAFFNEIRYLFTGTSQVDGIYTQSRVECAESDDQIEILIITDGPKRLSQKDVLSS
jgi:hypothetical protein